MAIKKLNMLLDSIKYVYIIISISILTALYEKDHNITFYDVFKRSLFIVIAIIIWYSIFEDYYDHLSTVYSDNK
jgi:hypothetical protein